MTFIWARLLWLLLLVPVLVLVYILAQRRRQKYAVRYSSLSLVRDALGHGPGIRRHIPPALFLLAIGAMLFALARPQASVLMPSHQGTIVLAIDTSGSMRATDMMPNRLEAAKAAARAFVEKQPPNVRIGIVSFSESASIVQVPTKERESILAAINRLSLQRRTAIGSGITTSLDAIFEVPSVRSSPSAKNLPLGKTQTPTPLPTLRGGYAPAVIVLLTDGVSNTGPAPLEVVVKAYDKGVRIYTVGVGSQTGATLRFEGYAVRVRLDEDTLKKIAQRTDGTYFKADTETDLQRIYQELGSALVFNQEKTELTAWFTALAALLALVAGVLSMLWFNRLL